MQRVGVTLAHQHATAFRKRRGGVAQADGKADPDAGAIQSALVTKLTLEDENLFPPSMVMLRNGERRQHVPNPRCFTDQPGIIELSLLGTARAPCCPVRAILSVEHNRLSR